MPKNTALILSWPYFNFLLHDRPDNTRHLNSRETEILLSRTLPANSQGQKTADYITGTGTYPGIVREYTHRGHFIELIEERFFLQCGADLYKKYDLFDMQFTARIPPALIDKLEAEGKQIIGWASPQLAGKAAQADLLTHHPRTARFLPEQIVLSGFAQLQTHKDSKTFPEIDAEYLIAKPLYSSRSRMPDGSDYRVFPKSAWPQFLELALKHPAWFAHDNGLLVSELVETRDPFLKNNNAVLHKVHLPAGLPDELWRQWPLQCRKFSARIELDRIGRDIRHLGDLLQPESWEPGLLEDYREDLHALTRALPPRPCLYSADLMIRPNGRLVFLEFNKLAGTFLEKIYGDQCPLGLYMEKLTQIGLI
ncbi:MAG: hypothetical protein EHM45_20530 [Desulfobacteraceae bacterium]|nr:MAG: hypothetical protein EHM45_20530 [Desulfobacteraceae bacterium]